MLNRTPGTLGRGCFARAQAKSKVGELYLYDAIGAGWFGGISSKDVAQALKELDGAKTLKVYVNSPGGDVFEGVAIHNLLARWDGETTVYVDGLCASIASIIAMAGQRIVTAANGMWMIHDPWGMVVGNARECRKVADELDKVRDVLLDTYARRTGATRDDLVRWMADETWMDATTAKTRKFTDEVTAEEPAAAANAATFPILAQYGNVPAHLRPAAGSRTTSLLATMSQRTMKHSRAPAPGNASASAGTT